MTCEMAKKHPGPRNTNLTCYETRVWDNLDGPTKYCVIRAESRKTEKLKNHLEFVYQLKCRNDEDCAHYYPDTEFTKCASDGVCENEVGMDM